MSEHHHDHIGLQPGKRVQGTALLAILVASLMIVMKGFAWLLTGSVALLGSFLDSIIDLSLSVMNFFAIRHAQTPADEEHRFGHGKAEALAALVQGAALSLAALFLVVEAVRAVAFSVNSRVTLRTLDDVPMHRASQAHPCGAWRKAKPPSHPLPQQGWP